MKTRRRMYHQLKWHRLLPDRFYRYQAVRTIEYPSMVFWLR
jgi:hypothetical protein